MTAKEKRGSEITTITKARFISEKKKRRISSINKRLNEKKYQILTAAHSGRVPKDHFRLVPGLFVSTDGPIPISKSLLQV